MDKVKVVNGYSLGSLIQYTGEEKPLVLKRETYLDINNLVTNKRLKENADLK